MRRAGGASHCERRQPKLTDNFLTFRTYPSNDLVSRKMVHTAMAASFRQSDGHENAGRRRPRIAIRGHARQLHIPI